MKKVIQAIRRKEMPSKFGGTWTIVEAKFTDEPNKVYELKGFNKKMMETISNGQTLQGYETIRSYQGKNGPVQINIFNAITAEYVYELILKIRPDVELLKDISRTSTTVKEIDSNSWGNDVIEVEPNDTVEPSW